MGNDVISSSCAAGSIAYVECETVNEWSCAEAAAAASFICVCNPVGNLLYQRPTRHYSETKPKSPTYWHPPLHNCLELLRSSPCNLYRQSATVFTDALWAGSHRLCVQTAVGSQGQSSSTTVLLSTEMAFSGFYIVLQVSLLSCPRVTGCPAGCTLCTLIEDTICMLNSFVPSDISRIVMVHKMRRCS